MRKIKRRVGQSAVALAVAALSYLALAYVAFPELLWMRESRLPQTSDGFLTRTAAGVPGDPVNLALAGSRQQLARGFLRAGWSPADPVSLRTAIEIGLSVALDRPFSDAPVSTLLLFGKPQDLAFEKAVGDSADRRHHVRFWLLPGSDAAGQPLWYGAASFDRGVGFSHETGQVTHHIGPDLDAERDLVMAALAEVGAVRDIGMIAGIGPVRDGRNGGGDPYFTDGRIARATLVAEQ